MPLAHPTMAEQARSKIEAKVGQPQVVCLSMGAEKSYETRNGVTGIVYTFDDDSSLTTIGRGRGQTIVTDLP